MTETGRGKQTLTTWFKSKWSAQPLFSTVLVLLLMVLIQAVVLIAQTDTMGEFWSKWMTNWLNILRNNAGVGIIALGMTFVIISGGIDLSVGSMVVVIGAFVMMLIDTGSLGLLQTVGVTGVPAYIIAILLGCLLGMALGGVNGVLITKGKMPPFIATLGTMMIYRSVTQQVMQGYTPSVPRPFLQIASIKIGGQMVMPMLYWLILAIVFHIISRRTTFGRQVIAIGSNERAARLSGVNVNKIKLRVYVLIGFLVALSTILQVSRIGSMDYANAGSGYEMDAISATIVGGTSMSGGRGTIVGTAVGTLIIVVMNNLLNLIGVPPFLREAFKGVILIFAVLLQKKESS